MSKNITKLIDHLKSRGMDPFRYAMSIDGAENVVSFYLFNLSHQIIGYQQYRPDSDGKKVNDPKLGRYYTYLPRGTDGFFGLEQLNSDDRNIFIVEGVFKAATLHRLGYNSIAVLTSSPKRLKPWFKIMRQTWNLIAIGDNDPAGKLLINTVKNGFQSPQDIDEMTDEEVHEMIRENMAVYASGEATPLSTE